QRPERVELAAEPVEVPELGQAVGAEAVEQDDGRSRALVVVRDPRPVKGRERVHARSSCGPPEVTDALVARHQEGECPAPPSMRFRAKARQAFFLAARPARAAGLVPTPDHVPALLQGLLSPRPPAPYLKGGHTAAAGEEGPSSSPRRGTLHRRAGAQATPVGW